MCIAAHEMKRLGLAHKPMIIGLKANVAEILALASEQIERPLPIWRITYSVLDL